ncbi:MAG TPA: hypothetical protein VIL09_06315 [Microvirga sp.]|jgi:hypothetical protein
MARYLLILGALAPFAVVPLLAGGSSIERPVWSDPAAVEALCDAGVKPARECPPRNAAAAPARVPDAGTWADPGKAEAAAAEILAATPDAPPDSPSQDAPDEVAETGSVEPSADSPPPAAAASAEVETPAAAVAAAVPPANPANPAVPEPNGTPEEQSRELATRFLASWSSANAMAEVSSFYGPKVNYFGRSLDLDAVAEEKRRFVDRWPARSYRHRPGTLAVDCETGGRSCTVRSIVDYEAQGTAKGSRARGAARLELVVDLTGEKPVVRSERSTPLRALAAARAKAPRKEPPRVARAETRKLASSQRQRQVIYYVEEVEVEEEPW